MGVSKPINYGTFTRCVRCKSDSCLVSNIYPFNAWFYCNKCKLSGDSIQMYMNAYKIKDPVAGVNALKDELKVSGQIHPEDTDKYNRFHHDYCLGTLGVWEEARRQAKDLAVYGPTDRLYELGLWHSKEIFEQAFSNWIGVMQTSQLADFLKKDLPRGLKPFERLIVIPYFLKPGFIAGFGLIGTKDILHHVSVLDSHIGGFAGLGDTASPDVGEVFCLTDVLSAARIKQKATIEGYRKISIIASAPVPTIEFCQVTEPVTVWVDEPTPEILKRCVIPKNFKILLAETPYKWSPMEKKSVLWETKTLPEIHNIILNKTVHDPVELFIKVLLDKPFTAAAALISELSLTDYQQKVIMSACPDIAKSDLSKLLNKATTIEPVVLNKKTYYQKDGKWWVSGSRETGDEIVSDVLLTIHHVCRISSSSKAYVFGTVTYGDKSFEFQADEEDMENHGRRAVYEILSASGITGQPFIADSIKKSIFEIALLFKTPEVIMVQDYVGFNEAQNRFNLPNISIDPSAIRVGSPFVIADEFTPCTNITVEPGLEMASITRLFQNTPETIVYWAGMASIVANINNTINKQKNNNVLFVGKKDSLAHHIFDTIKIDLGLISPKVKSSKNIADLLHLPAQTHHVPVALDGLATSQRVLSKWLEGEGYNSMVVASPLYAAAMGCDKDWTMVRADVPTVGESLALLKSEFVFPFVLQLMLTTKPSDACVFLDHLGFMGKSMGADTTVLKNAKALISEGGLIRTSNPLIQLVNFLNIGMSQDIFKTLTAGKFQKTYTILNDPWKNTISLNISNFVGQLRYYDLPIANWDGAFKELKAIGGVETSEDNKKIITLPKDKWQDLVTKTTRVTNAYAQFLDKTLSK